MGISSDLTPPNRNGGRKGNQLNLLRKFLGGKNEKRNKQLGGGFKYFFIFIPIPGEMIHFHQYFSMGLKPPTRQALLNYDYMPMPNLPAACHWHAIGMAEI